MSFSLKNLSMQPHIPIHHEGIVSYNCNVVDIFLYDICPLHEMYFVKYMYRMSGDMVNISDFIYGRSMHTSPIYALSIYCM